MLYKEESLSYRMGFDCAMNGPNTINCHFSMFSTPEETKKWERGKVDGEKKRE